MNILHICESATIRVIKQVLVHQSQWPTYLWYKTTFHRDLMGCMGNQSTWTNQDQLKQKLQNVSNVDLIHVHTSLENAAILSHIDSVTDIPIVWDMHDWTDNPRQWAEYCKAMIVPSQGYKDRLEKIVDIPVNTLLSMVPREMFPKVTPGPLLNAGVLVSGVGAPDGKHTWRDYTEVQGRIPHRMFIYPGSLDLSMHDHYDNLMLVSPYLRMLKSLTQYSFGYAGAANSRHTIHDCVTNKFWEYIAAGIPVVTYRSDNMTELLKQWWGESLDDLATTLPLQMWVDHREAMLERRFDFTMESQTETFKKVYEEVLG